MLTSAPALTVDLADYSDPRDAADVVALLDAHGRLCAGCKRHFDLASIVRIDDACQGLHSMLAGQP